MLFTFLGEKLSAVLPGSEHFAWDLPKELHDQSDVVCPPPHTSQRGTGTVQHYSMHTHINTTGCMGLTHTAASGYCMDTLLKVVEDFIGLFSLCPIITKIRLQQHKSAFMVFLLSASVHVCPC